LHVISGTPDEIKARLLGSIDAFFEIYTESLSDTIFDRGPEPPEGVLRHSGETTTMQTLNIDRPDMPDLQFVLLVTALCTSRRWRMCTRRSSMAGCCSS
jgi:hypothetical protein